jgi:hypothetical protein
VAKVVKDAAEEKKWDNRHLLQKGPTPRKFCSISNSDKVGNSLQAFLNLSSE